MDPIRVVEEFRAYLRDSAEVLSSLSARLTTYEDDRGETYEGFTIAIVDSKREERYGIPGTHPYYLGGNWGHQSTFLTPAGNIMVYVFTGEDRLVRGDDIETTLTGTVYKVSLGNLIGTGKEPFSEIRKKIDTMIMRAYADGQS